MATPQGPTYEDYAACVPPANRHKLQQELDCESGDGVDLHLGELAHLLVDWELLAPKLDLTDVDISDVHSDNKSAELERLVNYYLFQLRVMIKKWPFSGMVISQARLFPASCGGPSYTVSAHSANEYHSNEIHDQLLTH